MTYKKERGSLPRGSNKLKSREMFFERQYFSSSFPSYLPHIDLWDDKQRLFGRVNFKNETIFTDEGFLSPLPRSVDLFALNFVCEAYGNLRSFIDKKIKEKKLHPRSFLHDLTPYSAWTSPIAAHHRHIERAYLGFLQWAKNTPANTSRTPLDLLLAFMGELGQGIHFTLESFIRSNLFSPSMTGLIISHNEGEHSEDQEKMKWINDPNFAFFCEASHAHGFLVNKNAPWEIIFDIGRPNFRLKGTGAGLDTDRFFSYTLAGGVDIERTHSYLNIWTTSGLKDLILNSEPTVCVSEGGLVKIVDGQRLVPAAQMHTSPRQKVENYLRIRLAEECEHISDIEEEFERLHGILEQHGQEEACKRINRLLIFLRKKK